MPRPRTRADESGRGGATKDRSQWLCPTCGRRFAKLNQWHSCKRRSVDSHFTGKTPALRRLFDILVTKLRKTGPLRIDAVQSSINLISGHHFGGVTVRREYLRVGFLASERIISPRIVRTEVLAPNRVGHAVIVRDVKDIDRDLLSWMATAQKLQV